TWIPRFSTAITAKDAGGDVLVLEKQSPAKHTPNTMMSGGGIHVASDIEDAAKYFKAVAFGVGLPDNCGDPPHIYPLYPEQFVEELALSWAEGVVETGKFLRSLGDVDMTETVPSPAFPSFPGAQSYGKISVKGQGIALFALLRKAVEKRGIQVLWEHPGTRLIINEHCGIIGVTAERNNRPIHIKARKAVVLAAGGFACSEDLKRAFLPGWGWAFIGNPGNTGDGLKMAMQAGAALTHMHRCLARLTAGGIIIEQIGTGFNCRLSEPGRILVDNYGERYGNELLTSRDPDRYQFYKQVIVYDTSKLEYPRIPSWLIFDEKVRLKGPLALTSYGAHAVDIYHWSQDNCAEIERGWILRGSSIEELATKIASHRDNKGRMQAATLVETVSRFNRFCEEGIDRDFGRPREILGPLETPPYYAIAEYPGGPNTEGGPIRNAKAQVIDTFGKPIPRLYAAGEVASAWSFLYQAGGNLAECIICGRAAGQNAAMEKRWET
ncbi:FAD-binding protein, partial [Chloroflexota bacterium]